MAKIRIYELARALNMTNQALLERLAEMGIEAKSHMSSLEEDIVEKVKQEIFAGGSPQAAVVEKKRVGSNVIRKRKQKTVAKVEAEPEEPEESDQEEAVEEEEISEAQAVVESEAVAEDEAAEEMTTDSVEAVTEAEAETEAAKESESEAEAELDAEAEAAAEAPTEVTDAAEKPSPKEETPAAEEETERPVSPANKRLKAKKHQAAKIIKFPDAATQAMLKSKTSPPPSRETAAEPPTEETSPDGMPVIQDSTEADRRLGKKVRKKQKRVETDETEDVLAKRKPASKRKEIVEGAALYDIKPRGRVRKKGKGKARPTGSGKTQITTPKAIKRRLKIDESITVSDMAKRMGVKANEIIRVLMGMGVMSTVNQSIDFETAVLVAAEFEYEVEKASIGEDEILLQATIEDEPHKLVPRAPVVTIMGHVDHGKTSLLDVIRQSRITESEAGGITQHIGAYKVKTDKGEVVFLDTPGHEAFTAMRSRGAQATDIVVLVVAADDGVMPQTIEAINHSRAADVPIVVAVNKIDKDAADSDRVKRELAEQGLIPEDWGGDTIFVEVSAKQKIGIDNLLDMILLQSEMLELKANPDKHAKGIVLESQMDPGQGPLATVLVREGTLSVGETIVCGVNYGKIRAMMDDGFTD